MIMPFQAPLHRCLEVPYSPMDKVVLKCPYTCNKNTDNIALLGQRLFEQFVGLPETVELPQKFAVLLDQCTVRDIKQLLISFMSGLV